MKYVKITSLTINESKWANGSNKKRSVLLTTAGNMCCLGFLGKACGLSKEKLLNVTGPTSTINYFDDITKYNWPKGVCKFEWETEAICLNDGKNLTYNKRKSLLREHFKKIGIKLIFKRNVNET